MASRTLSTVTFGAVARPVASSVARSVATSVAGAPDTLRFEGYLVDESGTFENYNTTDQDEYLVRDKATLN